MASSTRPSINAAIEQLRAEIIAPDWQLSPQRLNRLRACFASLRIFFAKRSHALALLKMAISVVDHIDNKGCQAKAMDFLKEDMAHIVSLYEEDGRDPDQEKEIVSRAYKRFQRLGITLTQENLLTAEQQQGNSALLDKLEQLAEEAAHLPGLLAQCTELSSQENRQATSLLGKISAAINIAWAQLPRPPK